MKSKTKIPTMTFFSIRTVRAKDVDQAITKVEDQEFYENHPICDKVLPLPGIIEELFPNAHILTDSDGDFHGVFTGTKKEIRQKVLNVLTDSYGDDIKIKNFSLGYFTASGEDIGKNAEYYLSPAAII